MAELNSCVRRVRYKAVKKVIIGPVTSLARTTTVFKIAVYFGPVFSTTSEITESGMQKIY